MRKFLLSIFGIAFAYLAYSQNIENSLDSLDNLLRHYAAAGNDSAQSVVLNAKYGIHINNDFEQAINDCKQAIALAEVRKNYRMAYDWYLKLSTTYRKWVSIRWRLTRAT